MYSFKEALAAQITAVSESANGAGQKVHSFKAVIVEEGLTRNKKRYYTKEALKSGVDKFVGAKMFLNHQNESEKTQRPERSVEDEVATIVKAWYDESEGKGRVMGEFVIHGSPTLEAEKIAAWIQRRKESGVSVELSLNGYLVAESGKTESGAYVNYIKKFEAIESVDFVTIGNAYGKVKESFSILEETEKETKKETVIKKNKESFKKGGAYMNELDILLKDVDEDVATAIKAKFAESKAALDKATESLTGLQKEIDGIKAEQAKAVVEAKKEKLLTEAKAVVKESKLPELAKDKIIKSLESTTVDEKTESLKDVAVKMVESEKSYIEKVSGVKVFAHLTPEGEGKKTEESLDSLLSDL